MKNEGRLGLQGGFSFDFSHCLGADRLSMADLEAFKPAMEAASAAVQAIHGTGFAKAHLSKDGTPEHVFFSRQGDLKDGNPNTEASVSALEAFGARMQKEADVVIFLGIGGSFLGNKMLFDAYCGPYWNDMSDAERKGYPRVFFSGNNLDAGDCVGIYAQLGRLAAAKGAPLHVELVPISKSGTTLEPLACFSYFFASLEQDKDHFSVGVTAVTGTDPKQSALFRLATVKKWPVFEMPEGIGGRYCVFSNVGLITAAAIGMSIRELLGGAQEMAQHILKAPVDANPALVNAAIKFLAIDKCGKDTEVFMGYGNRLKSLGEWYVQLLAESLGKRFNREGKLVNYGRTPIVAVGTTDMHAQTQQHQDGKRNKIVQFLEIAEPYAPVTIPNPFAVEPAVAKYAGRQMHALLKIALDANETALASDNRPSARYVLPSLAPRYLGQLLMFLMFSIAYEGELADTDAYDQPGVEAYKKIMNATIAAGK